MRTKPARTIGEIAAGAGLAATASASGVSERVFARGARAAAQAIEKSRAPVALIEGRVSVSVMRHNGQPPREPRSDG